MFIIINNYNNEVYKSSEMILLVKKLNMQIGINHKTLHFFVKLYSLFEEGYFWSS